MDEIIMIILYLIFFLLIISNEVIKIINLNEIKSFYITNILDKKNETLQNLGLRLESVSVEAVLKRGFAWIRNGRRKTVCNADEARKNGSLEIVFADGAVKVRPIVRKNELQGDLFDD